MIPVWKTSDLHQPLHHRFVLQPISANLVSYLYRWFCASRQIVCISRPVWRCITRNNFRLSAGAAGLLLFTPVVQVPWMAALQHPAAVTDITKIGPIPFVGGGFYDWVLMIINWWKQRVVLKTLRMSSTKTTKHYEEHQILKPLCPLCILSVLCVPI